NLPTILHLEPATPRRAEHLATGAHHKAAARRERAVNRPGNLGVLDLDFALEDPARSNGQLGGVDHRRFDSALDYEPFGILNGPLHADAPANHQGLSLRRIAHGR